MKDQEPRGEYPNQHSISFEGPSHKSLELLNYALGYRLGATPWEFPQVDLSNLVHDGSEFFEIAVVGLPIEYPIREIVCIFCPYEYENSPYIPAPKHVTGYEIEFKLPLRQPQQFTEETAKRILSSLQVNTGMGEYRQLPNGKHQIVIPGAVLMQIEEGAPAWVARNFQTTEGVTTVLELGYDDPDRGIRYLQELKAHERMGVFDEEYIDERLKDLEEIKQNPVLDKLRIRLKSDEVFDSWIDKGDNNQIEDRRGDLGVDEEVLDKFYERAAFLLEAVCDTLGPKDRRKVLIRVEHPDVNLIPGGRETDIIGKPPASLSKPGATLDDLVREAGRALDQQKEAPPEIPTIEVSTRSESPRQEAFSGYMAAFLKRIQAKEVVEVESDVRLRIATNLAPCCQKYYSVNLPDDTQRMKGWYELMEGMADIHNVELISGNAIKLSELVPHADVVILHNVLLDLTGEDIALAWKYKNGEIEAGEKEWAELASRFKQAKEQGYREFLKVASPGYVIVFQRPDAENALRKLLVDTLGVKPTKIEQIKLRYDGSDDVWEAYIINNT